MWQIVSQSKLTTDFADRQSQAPGRITNVDITKGISHCMDRLYLSDNQDYICFHKMVICHRSGRAARNQNLCQTQKLAAIHLPKVLLSNHHSLASFFQEHSFTSTIKICLVLIFLLHIKHYFTKADIFITMPKMINLSRIFRFSQSQMNKLSQYEYTS